MNLYGLGLPVAMAGATAATRYVGATASGAPASGTFAAGDFVVDGSGAMQNCTAGGTPGTWVTTRPASPASVAGNSVTQASFNNLFSATIPAGDAVVGAVYKLTSFGNATWGSTEQALSVQLQLGGNTIGSTVVLDSTVFAISAALRWHAEAFLVCVTTGVSGTWWGNWQVTMSQITNNIIPGTAADNAVAFASGNTTVSTVDTTIAETFAMQVKWASTTGAPSITQRAVWLERVA